MKYIHVFDTNTEFQAEYNGEGYGEPWVSCTIENEEVNYNKPPTDPLTFEITSSGTINWDVNTQMGITPIEYKKNDGDWTVLTTTPHATIEVQAGDVVQFRGDNSTYAQTSTASFEYGYCTFSGTTCGFVLKGNLMSLISSTGYDSIYTLEGILWCLFAGCSGLTDASELLLQPTTLEDSCYRDLFANCPNLTKAPELPAQTLSDSCYNGMFNGCTNLNYIKCLATDISASVCTGSWVRNVQTTSGTFVAASNRVSWPRGDSGIPNGWTRENMVEID